MLQRRPAAQEKQVTRPRRQAADAAPPGVDRRQGQWGSDGRASKAEPGRQTRMTVAIVSFAPRPAAVSADGPMGPAERWEREGRRGTMD